MGIDLAAFRSAVDVTQQDIADATGLSQGTISRIEKRLQRPKGDALLRIQFWADELARRKRLQVEYRLSWDWLQQEQTT